MTPSYETGLLLLAAILLFAAIGWYSKRTRTVTERQVRMQKLIDDVVVEVGRYSVQVSETKELSPHMDLLLAIERLRAEVNNLCREADRR